MNGHCVKCKTKREIQNPQPLFNARGSAYSKGTCPVCGTNMMCIGATDAHSALDRDALVAQAKQKAVEKETEAAENKTTVSLRTPKGRGNLSDRKNGTPVLQGPVGEGGTKVARAKKKRLPKTGESPVAHESSPGAPLVIVESPAKARTIGRFLGSKYRVRASIGHIRDLPLRQMGVDLEQDFQPHYVIAPKKQAVVKELKSYAQQAPEIFLATDPDREGEAISWHLAHALDTSIRGKPLHRVEFHEITPDAIARAFANPRAINQQLVDAQQARRVLDRIVGYTISPLLRKKINTKNLSAGRVQSVAVRLVVEREREIQAFVSVEYWSIEAELCKQKSESEQPKADQKRSFRAKLVRVANKDFECHAGEDALKLKAILEKCSYQVLDVRKKEVLRNPSPPFITSTLQQEASRKLGFNAKRTMAIAQQLYEGISLGDAGSTGLITYMRTDSTNISESAGKEAWAYIKEKFGQEFLPRTPRIYSKKVVRAQEAHEAIRPTSTFREPDAMRQFLDADQSKLYELIWKRFIASQMASAILDTTAVDIGAFEPNHSFSQAPNYLFRANGSIVKFRGFLAVYQESRDEKTEEEQDRQRELPPLTKDEPLDLLGIFPEQHFTEPPPRYTEATLIKALEQHGIGRPSTYAPIMSTIQERGYIDRMPDRRLKPTELAFVVNDLLVKHFTQEVDLKFTAQMEEKFDRIAEGEAGWVTVLRDFYGPFKMTLDRAMVEMPNVTLAVETSNEKCDLCGSSMVVRRGRFGKFLACSTYPKCKGAKNLSVHGGSANTGVTCPDCKLGEMVEKRSKRGRIFYSCNRYPLCKYAVSDKPINTPCPKCGGLLVMKNKGTRCVNGDYESASLSELQPA